jgi:pyruvate kinase
MNGGPLDVSHVALKRRRTKIVATVGPASSTDAVIEQLIKAGVDVFRLNFSHGTHELHGANIERIRRAADRLHSHTAILADLCGPKIRVGLFEGGGIDLVEGTRIVIACRDVVGKPGLVPSQYAQLARDVQAGDRVLLDDGKLEVRVDGTSGEDVHATVVRGGRLTDKKGMNLPGVRVSAPSLTDKDKVDATFAAERGVDFMALSFVRRASDVVELREHLGGARDRIGIVAKIEKPEALEEIGSILDVVDGIMVARGDLGVEMPPEMVPVVQQELIRRANEMKKPVIVATQMLESMIEASRPTRAEVTDVAFAALERADAVMLSAETAAGKHPVEAVATMDRVLRIVEGYQWKRGLHGDVRDDRAAHGALAPTAALSRATSLLSGDLGVRAVVVPTRSGRTARLVSAERPAAPIVVLASDEGVCRRVNLSWGVSPERVPADALKEPRAVALVVVRRMELAEPGQSVLLVWDASSDVAAPQPTVSILSC